MPSKTCHARRGNDPRRFARARRGAPAHHQRAPVLGQVAHHKRRLTAGPAPPRPVASSTCRAAETSPVRSRSTAARWRRYRDVLPTMQLGGHRRRDIELVTTRRGSILAAGVGGAIPARGDDAVDRPIKALDALTVNQTSTLTLDRRPMLDAGPPHVGVEVARRIKVERPTHSGWIARVIFQPRREAFRHFDVPRRVNRLEIGRRRRREDRFLAGAAGQVQPVWLGGRLTSLRLAPHDVTGRSGGAAAMASVRRQLRQVATARHGTVVRGDGMARDDVGGSRHRPRRCQRSP